MQRRYSYKLILLTLFTLLASHSPLVTAEECFRVGSFGLTDASRWRDELKATGVNAWLSDDRHRDWQGTWIVVPTADMRDRIGLSKELDSLGVKDWQVLTKGDQAGWISVGIFDKPEGVERRLKQLEPLNREVMLEPKFSGKGRYDVHFRLSEGTAKNLAKEMGQEKIACPESGVKTPASTSSSAAGATRRVQPISAAEPTVTVQPQSTPSIIKNINRRRNTEANDENIGEFSAE